MLRKNIYCRSFQCHPSQSMSFGFLRLCIPIDCFMVKSCENMKMNHKHVPIYALHFLIWACLAPQYVIMIGLRCYELGISSYYIVFDYIPLFKVYCQTLSAREWPRNFCLCQTKGWKMVLCIV